MAFSAFKRCEGHHKRLWAIRSLDTY